MIQYQCKFSDMMHTHDTVFR